MVRAAGRGWPARARTGWPFGEEGATGLASIFGGMRRRGLLRVAAVGLAGAAAAVAFGARLTWPAVPGPAGVGALAAAGLAVSLVLGSVLAVVLERRDRTIRDARGVDAALGLPTLGLIPRVRRPAPGRKPHQHLNERPTSPYAEAVRAVLAALRTADDRPGRSRVLLVTSSLPGEGKTTFAVSLATVAARSGGRVVVIDLDLRQPNVHRELGHDQAHAGIVEWVAEGRPLEEVIRHDPATKLDFLPVVARTAEPTELIESDGMGRLLDACRARYDLIVIDTAPVGVITDAGVAARLADEVVFVVRWGRTPGSVAREALRALRAEGVEPVGVVLTRAGGRGRGLLGI